MTQLPSLRSIIATAHLAAETPLLDSLCARSGISLATRQATVARAANLVTQIRTGSKTGMMEVFLAEYGLSTDEGVALMCLAEALLRVPDADTIDELIEDKIAPSSWGEHLGKSSSTLVNASTWALMLTGKVLREGETRGVAHTLHSAIKRLGEPVIRTAVGRAMKELGHQFVLGRDIREAVKRGKGKARSGFTFSYDMLGEAALTSADAEKYNLAYEKAIAELAGECRSDGIRENPGISIKLSALHPRYELAQRDRVMAELVPTTLKLCQRAKAAGMGLNIDAEEADRLDLSLDIIEAVLSHPSLEGWHGFGVVVQAYGKRAPAVIDWLHALTAKLDRKIMLRLVKGAYWDTEIKLAQVEGLKGFPVYTRKVATDVAYICCAAKLLGMTDRIYPQFATHNAHTVAAILELATDPSAYEFQRLHGMGEALHDIVLESEKTRCRIYAPVGAHRDLLAYLVRRLLENGANSSFVNQIVDENVAPALVAADPFAALDHAGDNSAVIPPSQLFAPERSNAIGWDLRCDEDLDAIATARSPFAGSSHQGPNASGASHPVENPADPDDMPGHQTYSTPEDVSAALERAAPWKEDAGTRATTLERAADLYEDHFGELFALMAREAGKTQADAVGELREAVDFLRYYASRIDGLKDPALGLVTCISPWNFPLAIFTGQIAAALAAGNGVLAKPAESTTLIATRAVELLHEAGVPKSALQLIPGRGSVVGAQLTSDPRIGGICFTGSTQTAQHINRTMAAHLAPEALLIAETGGLNAMIVDSTALPEQAVRDIIASAFQSAGQRCSALRCLYVQEDIADSLLTMLYGAMDELTLGNPWHLTTDVGPVIDAKSRRDIQAWVDSAKAEGRLLKQLEVPARGYFVGPAVIRVNGIQDLTREVFGPVLHVATFHSRDLGRLVDDINAREFGLTFGMHSRIDDRIEAVTSSLNVGNMYINRNQIGAIVGSQPFGGEGLSGTGPKAGGPSYVPRFCAADQQRSDIPAGNAADPAKVEAALLEIRGPQRQLSQVALPGPTGESNQLSEYGRGTVLCLGPTLEDAKAQALIAADSGCVALMVVPGTNSGIDGTLDRAALRDIDGFDLVALWSGPEDQALARQALAARSGALIALATARDFSRWCRIERHICIDTTAAGGNAALLAEAS